MKTCKRTGLALGVAALLLAGAATAAVISKAGLSPVSSR